MKIFFIFSLGVKKCILLEDGSRKSTLEGSNEEINIKFEIGRKSNVVIHDR
jgi:hypothetical protein